MGRTSGWLVNLYRYPSFRQRILKRILRKEKGEFYSRTLRDIYREYHNIEIGMYSYGGCFRPEHIPAGTRIGRYCSFAQNVYIFNANHPIERISQHPFFYNPALGIVDEENITRTPLEIGNDVWIGQNAIIIPGVTRIGDGAVVAAGAIVTKNIPDFAIVGGCPAKVLRYRFSEEIQRKTRDSQWWNLDIEEIRATCFREFLHPVDETIAGNLAKQFT